MFHPRLANLFEPLSVISPTAHAIKVLWNNGMIGIGQRVPIDWLVAVVARNRSDSKPYRSCITPSLLHGFQISHDNIGARHKVRHSRADCMLDGWHDY